MHETAFLTCWICVTCTCSSSLNEGQQPGIFIRGGLPASQLISDFVKFGEKLRAVKRKEIPSTLFSCKTITVHVGTRPSQLSIYVQSIYRKLEDVKLVSVGRHVYAVLWEDVGSLR